MRIIALLALMLPTGTLSGAELSGSPVQGGMLQGFAEPGSKIHLDDTPVPVGPDGLFIIGFGRDAPPQATLQIRRPDGAEERIDIDVAPREYEIQRIDGLPPKQVTPPPEVLERIRREAQAVAAARAARDLRPDFRAGFVWPSRGPISGVYGSQRILNGEPRRPHFGVDVAAPEGAPVVAPAPGIVTMAEPDLYYSGGTLIIDHGHGLTSSFLHLSEVLVEPGQRVAQGDLIGRVGATGRATGPHLDWRMNLLDARIDPQLLVEGDPTEASISAD